MSEAPSFACEYAKSDRSACKLCKSTISMASLRLAIFVQSPFFDGKVPNWYHFNCFFKKATPSDTSFIKGFEALRWDDQQKIKEKLGLVSVKSEDNAEDEETNEGDIDQFTFEYSKSNRSKCKKCEAKIEKDVIRVSIKGNKSGFDGNYHLECFSKYKSDYGFNFKPEEVSGFDQLDKKDQVDVDKSIGKPVDATLKRKLEIKKEEVNDDTQDPEAKKIKNEIIEKEKLLKTQSEQFWKLRDSIDKELPNDTIKTLISDNDQNLTKAGREDLLTFLCDAMYFGPLKRCSECKNGQLVYRGMAYYCTGNITDWTNCSHRTQTPERKDTFEVSSDLKSYTCVKNFKFKPRKRVFEKTLEEIDAEKNNLLKSETNLEDLKLKQPLYNLNFSSIGKLKRKNADIKILIERLGGKFSSSLNPLTIVCISNQDEIDKMNKKMRESESSDIFIVSEAFLDDLETDCKNIKIQSLIENHKICSWGSDLKLKIENCLAENEKHASEKSEKFSVIKSMGDGSGKIKMKIKGGAVVDPESGLEDEAHVLLEPKTNEPYTCVLGLVDILRGTNSYYKLQIIEDDKKSKYYLFRAWGRVGTTIGGNKLENHSTKTGVINEFCALYLEKTGNAWDCRKSASKQANKFYPLEMDYGDDDEGDVKSKISDKDYVSTSGLAKPVQDIIKLIFDIETMKQQMKEFEIDLNKMPLGKISSNQIKLAFSVLNELNDLIDKKGSKILILDASNRFYTLIPHDFGMKKPPLLDEEKMIKEKTDMLNSLLDIEIAYNILKTDSDCDEDPIDLHYKKLKCQMEVVEHKSEEFKRMVQYVENTHAATHGTYKLVVEDIFKVVRGDEEQRYTPFKSLHNRKLLWHGSRLTNYAGILSQGLRIAPPEAPCTGYMFGKGVYFADMVSKSANYCFTSSSSPTGLLLLCEVALGDMYERNQSEYVTKLPNGKHSTKGCGRTAPAKEGSYLTPDGVEIPMGKGVDSGVRTSSLLYNEYIVYDVNQVVIKYLLRTKFVYNY